ncbi:hypothetical protein J7643_04945 [bacterium]|nr:hypothetical protein [bacterium]
MKLAFALACLLLIWIGTADLEPYRPRRTGRVQPLRRTPARRRRVGRH